MEINGKETTTPEDFIFNGIYKASMAKGYVERASKDSAVHGIERYRKGCFKTVSGMIKEQITVARKLSS